jgi:hypothetical protein
MRAGSFQVLVNLSFVMPGLVPGIHVLTFGEKKDVDGRDV